MKAAWLPHTHREELLREADESAGTRTTPAVPLILHHQAGSCGGCRGLACLAAAHQSSRSLSCLLFDSCRAEPTRDDRGHYLFGGIFLGRAGNVVARGPQSVTGWGVALSASLG